MRHLRGGAALALFAAATALLNAGCGSTSSKSSARIRVVDVATNAQTANILVNNASAYGDLNFEGSSPYLYVQTGTSTFSFTTTATLPATAIATTPSLPLNDGQFYTAYLIGRSDIIGTKFLKVVTADDSHPSAGSQALVRVLNAASDAGSVDVTFNGAAAFSAVPYPVTLAGSLTPPSPVTGYLSFAAGTVSVQANAAGTATVVLAPTNITLKAGQAYTLVLTEPAITPTYGLDLVGDN